MIDSKEAIEKINLLVNHSCSARGCLLGSNAKGCKYYKQEKQLACIIRLTYHTVITEFAEEDFVIALKADGSLNDEKIISIANERCNTTICANCTYNDRNHLCIVRMVFGIMKDAGEKILNNNKGDVLDGN